MTPGDGAAESRGLLLLGCPRCASAVEDAGDVVVCPVHGSVVPLRRAAAPSYDALGAMLLAADGFSTYVPWPLAPSWRVSDFAVVAGGGATHATMACCSGSSELDGPVDLMVIAEEPATGLGARCAGLAGDPGPEVGRGPAAAHVRLDGQRLAVWLVSPSHADADFDRSVVVGEAFGRWLWLVLRPASAILMLGEDLLVHDISGAGPALVEIDFGGPAPTW